MRIKIHKIQKFRLYQLKKNRTRIRILRKLLSLRSRKMKIQKMKRQIRSRKNLCKTRLMNQKIVRMLCNKSRQWKNYRSKMFTKVRRTRINFNFVRSIMLRSHLSRFLQMTNKRWSLQLLKKMKSWKLPMRRPVPRTLSP